VKDGFDPFNSQAGRIREEKRWKGFDEEGELIRGKGGGTQPATMKILQNYQNGRGKK